MVDWEVKTPSDIYIYNSNAVNVTRYRYGDLHGVDQVDAVQREVWQLRGSNLHQGLPPSHGL